MSVEHSTYVILIDDYSIFEISSGVYSEQTA